MSDDNLLGKADALLSRYRPSSSHRENSLPDFPVLTEVVDTTVESIPPLLAETDASPGKNSVRFHDDTLSQELKQLEEELRKKVLLAIEPYVASFLGELLETRIRSHMAPALDHLATEIANATKQEAAQLVREAVNGAVEREIAELQVRIKG